jgi:hypothetical protein
MSQMLTNIKRIVEEDISNRTSQLSVLIEAITNSIFANATDISCTFHGIQEVLKTDVDEVVKRKVAAIDVQDNGDGFDDLNFKSFGIYRSDYKAELGCKGVGRFVFLKVFENVKFTSWITSSKKKRDFTFSFDFNNDNMQEEDAEVTENKTLLRLSGVRPSHFNKDRMIDKRLDLDLPLIKDAVLTQIVPMLFLQKQKEKIIHITFADDTTDETAQISGDDIPDFKTKDFSVKGANGSDNAFTLYYVISEDGGPLRAFHCANGRTVCEFLDKELRIALPGKYAGYFLLESEYFNNHIDNERNEFNIFPIKTDAFSTLSWEIINTKIKIVISSLVKSNIPGAIEMNRVQLVSIQEERPYLADYIEPEDLDIAGFLDKKQIVKKAKKRFDDAKERLIEHSGKAEYVDQELQEAIQITQSELVAYIQDRVLVIERLKKMLTDKEQSEKIIHNLFMEKYTDDEYFHVGKNNLWLLDDRFTSYSYAASEKNIEEILKKMSLEGGSDIDKDRPDLALFYSDDPTKKRALKSVLIELKSFKEEGKTDREKFAGIQQLLDYMKAFKGKEDIKEIWAFLVTDIDDKFAERLVTNDFIPLFSTDQAIYSRDYKDVGFVYVIGVHTLIQDAEARNRVFIEIINKHSRLNKAFEAQIPTAEE